MPDGPDIAAVAALIGEPTRARMLAALMDGRARTATELALEGGITASTASSHLSRLTAAGLVAIASQGRHRYFRLAGADVAAAIEGLMGIAAGNADRRAPVDDHDGLRRARVCYDHLAGEAGVRLLERLRQRRLVDGDDESIALTARGEAWCREIGIDLAALAVTRRRLCRACLDWSERRTHLAGALGAAVLERLLALRYARRQPDSRAIVLSRAGERFIDALAVARSTVRP